MGKTRNRILAALGVAAFVATSAVSNAAVAATQPCLSAPNLSDGSTSTQVLTNSVILTQTTFEPGVANNGPYKSKFTIATGSLSKVDFKVSTSLVGEYSAQSSLATNINAIAYVNTDYYNEGTRVPYSAMIVNGKLIYAPREPTNVVGVSTSPFDPKNPYSGVANFKTSAVSFNVSGVNQPVMTGTSSASAATPVSAVSKLPANTAAVLLVNNVVSKLYLNGTSAKPKSGVLVIAKGTPAARIKKLKLGQKVSFKLPTAPAQVTEMVADRVWAYGKARSKTKVLTIRAVNYEATGVGITLFDSNFTKSRATTAGSFTLVLDSKNKVTKKYWGGSAVTVPPGGSVLQLGSDGEAFYRDALTWSTLVIENEFKSVSGKKITSASGRGNKILDLGVNIEVCDDRSEQIRPRTSIAWNNATGKIWLTTTSSGVNMDDWGFRQGGSTIHQLGDVLKGLGATDAVTVDGGGSATFLAKLLGRYKRLDVPDEAWIREIPIGAGLVPKP
ncbi:MAG: hypothetical protein RIR46_1293 [Actinomycetota bacterium]|jgi:hypothetical protein